MTFKLTGVEPVDGDHYTVRGDLTIKETTRPIQLDATVEGESQTRSAARNASGSRPRARSIGWTSV